MMKKFLRSGRHALVAALLSGAIGAPVAAQSRPERAPSAEQEAE